MSLVLSEMSEALRSHEGVVLEKKTRVSPDQVEIVYMRACSVGGV